MKIMLKQSPNGLLERFGVERFSFTTMTEFHCLAPSFLSHFSHHLFFLFFFFLFSLFSLLFIFIPFPF